MEQPIVACHFNLNGNLFAYAVSYDWSKVSVFYVVVYCVSVVVVTLHCVECDGVLVLLTHHHTLHSKLVVSV